MKQRPIFITGIGTGVGKTIASAVLVEKLKADYWKPIQSGDLDNSDTDTIKSLVSNSISVFHPESYRFTKPFSPHKAAELDGIQINLNHISLPQTDNLLIVEGAGGLMVPLNNTDFIVDLITKLDAEVILVTQHYLGSINHTILSIELLLARKVQIKGIIINGDEDVFSEKIICQYAAIPYLGRIETIKDLNKEAIKEMANGLLVSN